MEIKKCTSTHYTRTRNAKIKYLVLHYTGSTHSEPGTAVDTAKYFANATRPASADFICDDVNERGIVLGLEKLGLIENKE